MNALAQTQAAVTIKLPAALGQAQIVAWHVEEGAWLYQGKSVVTVKAGGSERTINAPMSGTLQVIKALKGEYVAKGATIALFAPDAPQRGAGAALQGAGLPGANRGQTGDNNGADEGPNGNGSAASSDGSGTKRDQLAPIGTTETADLGVNWRQLASTDAKEADLHQNNTKTTPGSAPAEAPIAPSRRSTLPNIEEIIEVEELHLAPAPTSAASAVNGKSKAKDRERVKLRGYHVLPSQEKAVKREVARLGLDEDLNCNESELIRAALDSFMSMTPAARKATLESYKAKEQRAQVGAGWPRPGRAKGTG